MGNSPSSKKDSNNELSLLKEIDQIASLYIRKENFEDMQNLSKKENCDKLIIMTADIISKYLKQSDIEYLSHRIENGLEVDELTNEDIIFLNKNNLNELDVEDPKKKERLCIGIAKFYVKIAHLYGAILKSLNPVYKYKNPNIDPNYQSDQMEEVSLKDKHKYEKMWNEYNIIPQEIKLNLCSNRIKALVNNSNFFVNNDEKVDINPDFCNINISNTGTTKSLLEEIGMRELQKLYWDDYDYKTGKFVGMTEEMKKKIFNTDLKTLYTAFTGENSMPSNIKDFSDIPLRNFHESRGCSKRPERYKKTYTASYKNKLFKKYADNIKTMIKNADKKQDELTYILKDIFVPIINKNTKLRDIIINPLLNQKLLQELIDKTRKILVELYIGCEEDFIKGLQIFEQIVENQIKQTSDIQISNLKKSLKETLEETPVSNDPETPPSSDNDPNSNPLPNSSNSTPQISTQPLPEQIDNSVSAEKPQITPSPEENEPSIERSQNESSIEGPQNEPSIEGPQNEPSIEGSQNEPPMEGSQNEPLMEGTQNEPSIEGSPQVNYTGVINTDSQPLIVTKQVMNPNENKLIPQLDNTSTDKLSNLAENSEVVEGTSDIN